MNYIYDINEYECVGDSLGKINYNFLYLESQLCQLSSRYFDDGYFTAFNKLSSIMDIMNNIGKVFNTVPLYKQCYTATNLLSSYWNRNEATVEYPVDIDNQIYQIDGVISDNLLVQLANNFITQKFASEDFLDISSVINIDFPLYSSNGVYVASASNAYSNPPDMKHWYVNLTKNDYSISSIRSFKFEKISGKWINITPLSS